ncbi:MAG TPA: EamA family transporter [Polyangia bacterium]|jgi:drug/metabolite transporter (DMT)-like permease|nr:EamA family transporter [Polyangia bacterium]
MSSSRPIRRGIGFAILAALFFGVTVPFLKLAGAGSGTWASASLLYLGAAAGGGLVLAIRRRPPGMSLIKGRAGRRLLAVAVLGAVCAPALLILGVKRTDAATTSLLLTLEMPFTLVLARLFFREHLGRRATVAAIVVAGGSLLLAGRPPGGDTGLAGVVFVAAATLAWALDNVISRTLADHDPLAVVALKGLLGGGISAAVAAASGELFPGATLGAALFVIGAVGFGLSLQLYLRAQTLVGAARTASVFAAAPFVGSVVSLALGSPWPGWHFPVAAGLLVVGVALHVSERHRHQHTHEPLVHEHMHTHDDQHHGHTHDPMPSGPHSHPHQHTRLTHEHEHSDDIHHRHRH